MKIVIVGGGTAGWMATAALAKTFPEYDITIIVGNEPIGVGESTTPHINQYLHYMGITDEVFIPAARATYKMSSRFENIAGEDHVFHYPNGQNIVQDPKFHHWMLAKAFYPKDLPSFAETFMPFVTVADAGKIPLNDSLLHPYDISKDRAFHIDGSKFATFLQETFCSNVRVVHSKVGNVSYNGKRIQSVSVERGPTDLREPKIDADLFIDCTGQASTLGGAQSKWKPFDSIKLDTAIVEKREYVDKDKEMVPYTNAKGMEAGWKWTIPTLDYISEGYVFSSKYKSVEGAKHEAGFTDPRVIKFRNGRYEEAWVSNCVKIGLSYSFIEPLESTSLFGVHHGILALIDQLRQGRPGQFARDLYNHNMAEHTDGWLEFVEAHYYYSGRRDTEFWREVTEDTHYDASSINSHDFVRFLMINGDPVPHDQSPILYILTGSGYTNINQRHYDYFGYPQTISQSTVENWIALNKARKQLARRMPTMHKYLKDTFKI